MPSIEGISEGECFNWLKVGSKEVVKSWYGIDSVNLCGWGFVFYTSGQYTL